MESLRGIISAMATPFTEDATAIDEVRLRQLVDRTVEDGADGLVVCASTGEFASMTVAERNEVAAITIEQAAGRVPVVVNTGAMSTAEAIQLSRDAEARGAAAVMPVAPYYDPLRLDETFAYYAAIAANIDIPIVAYNIPEVTGLHLSPEFLGRLGREIANVQYVKDSSGSFLQLARLTSRYADDIKVFCGVDAFVLPALELGAVGCIVGAANFIAGPLARLQEAVSDGDHNLAVSQWATLVPGLLAILDQDRFSFQAAVKSASRLTGLDLGAPRPPLIGVAPSDELEILEALRLIPELAERLPLVERG